MVDVLSVCIAVLALLVIGLIFSKVRKYRFEKMVHKLPGPDYNFLLGNATQLMVAREETAMGRSINAQRDTTSEYLTAVNDVSEILTYRVLSPLLQPDILFWLSPLGRRQRKSLRVIHGFANKIIKEKREEIEKGLSSEQPTKQPEVFGQKRKMAFLDLLLQSKGLSNEDIREEVDTFMFAGHDTTASTMAWTLFNIGRFPEVQRLVHEELDRVIGRDERPIMTEEIRELKYLECVIKESLRVIPVVANYSRLITEDVEICGYTVPAGSEANVNIYTIHRDPKHFPDPEKFDPERFLPEISSGRHPYAYIPFSAGPRNCVGQKFGLLEDKVMISNILRQFKVTSMQKMEDMRILNEIVLRPANGLWLKFESRDEN